MNSHDEKMWNNMIVLHVNKTGLRRWC